MSRVFQNFFQSFFDIAFGKVATCACGVGGSVPTFPFFQRAIRLPLTLLLYHLFGGLSRVFQKFLKKFFDVLFL